MSTDNSDMEADGAGASFGTNRDLFILPDSSHLGDCPICFLPLPLDLKKSILMSCCCKIICNGCDIANKKREAEMGLKQHKCAFCRELMIFSEKEADKRLLKRVKKNDPVATWQMGTKRYQDGDYDIALEYYTKAAELGNAAAHFSLSGMYRMGQVVKKDKRKEMYHLEEAAIRGHERARHNLGYEEWKNGIFERAKNHFIIAANLGYDESLTALRQLYVDRHASKEDYDGALRAYQAAMDATKSTEREVAEAVHLLLRKGQRGFIQS
jgi:TPR repeat protein